MLVRVHDLWGRVEDGCAAVAGVLIALAMGMTVFEVIARRVFNAPLPGVIDMFDLGMAAVAFLGASQCQRAGGHVRMELVVRKLKGRTLWVVESITTLCAFLFVAAVSEASAEAVIRAYRVGDSTMDLLLPVWPAKTLVTLALIVLAVRLGIQFIDSMRLVLHPDETPVAALSVASVTEIAQEEIAEAFGEHDDHSDKSPGQTP